MDLLNLAPDIVETLLFLPGTVVRYRSAARRMAMSADIDFFMRSRSVTLITVT